MKDKFLETTFSIKSVEKYVRNQVTFKNKRYNEPSMRKTGNRFSKMDEKPSFSGTNWKKYRRSF